MWALGLCVVALAATACSGYALDKEYHYKTEGKVLHELDKKTHQHAGFMAKSTVVLQFKENKILVKITDPQSHPVNERVDPDHHHEHHYHSIPLAVEHLTKPFEIDFDHEVLTGIRVAKDDPQWSVNVKKALAARFQLQNLHSKNESEKHYYTRWEDGPNGECEVDYEVDDGHDHEIHVTKTKNFEKCKTHTYRYYDNQNIQNCLEEEGNSVYSPLHHSLISHSVLTGTRENHICKKQEMEERFTYAPYGHEGDFLKGDAKLTIELEEVVPVTEPIHIADDAVTHHDLHFKFHTAEIHNHEDLKTHPYGFYYFLGQKHDVDKVAEMFEKVMVVDDHKKYTEIFNSKPMPFFFMKLYYAMSTLNYDELKDLHENHVLKEGQPGDDMRIRRHVFGDALVATGTSSAFMYLKDLLTSGKIEHPAVNHMLKQIPMSLQPVSEPLLEEFYEMCKSPYIHDHVQNRKVCLLALSTVVHEQCVSRFHKLQERYPPTEKIHCTPEIAEKFFEKFLAEPESHQHDSFSRILFIKVAGNFGTRGSLKELLKIVHDGHLHQYFRFNAIMALEHPAEHYWEEVLHAMMPIYFALDEPHEIRIAALLYILVAGPKMHQLEAIAENVEHEPDHQVAHYTMSAIEAMSHLEGPCSHEYAEMAKRVLRYFPRADFKVTHDFRHSFGWFEDGFNRKFQIGGGTFVNFITSNQSYVPQHVYLNFEDYVGRQIRSPLEIGYNGYGLDKVVDNLFGYRKFKDAQTASVEKELKEYDDKLHIEERKPEPMLGDFYIDAFGSTLDFFHFNDTTFENLAKNSASQFPTLIENMKDVGKASMKRFYVGRSQKFAMPSALGWPYYIDISEINFAHYRNNQFKLNVDPNLLTGAKNDEPPPTINLKIDAHIVHDRFLFAGMGSALPAFHLSASAGVLEREYCSLPLKLKLSLDPTTPKLVVKYTPIVPHTRVHKSYTPLTMVHNMSKPDVNPNEVFLPYHQPQKHELVNIEKEMFHDYLGYGLHFKGSVAPHRRLDSWGSFKKFMIENDLRTKLYYLQHNPLAVAYDYEISVTPPASDPTTEVDIEFTADHWGFDTHNDKPHTPPFPVVKDGHEDYINSQGDRKARSCVAKVDVVSKGTKERKLHVGLGYTHTFDDRYHQLNFNYDRSPWGHEEKDHLKVCYSASIMFPHVDMHKMHALDTIDIHPKIEVATDIHFGKNCEDDKQIIVRGEMTRTEESQHLQAERENTDDADNWDAKLYHKCKKLIDTHGHRYSRACRKFWYRALKLRHYKIDVEFKNLDKDDKARMEHLDTVFKHYLYYYLTEHHNEHEHDDHKMHIEANFSAKSDHVDIKVTKPDEILEFHHVPHPSDIQARSASPFFEFTNKIVKWSYYKFPFCAVEGNHVHTFDEVDYEMPPMDCYKVIAKDCSHKKLYTILAKKVANNRFHKAVKVFIGTWLIEALPISADSDITVRVNGEQIAVTEAEPHYHYLKHNNKDHLVFTVSYDGLFYKIRSHEYGVTVYYDGNAAVVTLSPYYRGKQCGLCGDFNNNDIHEFLGANDCYYQNATDFSYSYAIPGDGCQVPHITETCTHHER